MLQSTAIAIHVYDLSGKSSLAVGILALVRVVPMLLFTLIGGIVADHHDRRKVMFVTQSAMAFMAACFVAMEVLGLSSVPLIYVLVGLFAIARAFDGPARQAMVANLVPPE